MFLSIDKMVSKSVDTGMATHQSPQLVGNYAAVFVFTTPWKASFGHFLPETYRENCRGNKRFWCIEGVALRFQLCEEPQ